VADTRLGAQKGTRVKRSKSKEPKGQIIAKLTRDLEFWRSVAAILVSKSEKQPVFLAATDFNRYAGEYLSPTIGTNGVLLTLSKSKIIKPD